jgi:hypothetical protein
VPARRFVHGLPHGVVGVFVRKGPMHQMEEPHIN